MVRCATFYVLWLMTPPEEGTPEQWRKQAYLLLGGAEWTLEGGNVEEALSLYQESGHYAWSADMNERPYRERADALWERLSEEDGSESL